MPLFSAFWDELPLSLLAHINNCGLGIHKNSAWGSMTRRTQPLFAATLVDLLFPTCFTKLCQASLLKWLPLLGFISPIFSIFLDPMYLYVCLRKPLFPLWSTAASPSWELLQQLGSAHSADPTAWQPFYHNFPLSSNPAKGLGFRRVLYSYHALQRVGS